MPRLARLPFIPFAWYYVALRSLPGRKIVAGHADLVAVLKLLRATLREKGAHLHAGYVGEREAHLALQMGDVPLSSVTGRFQHEYARIFNRTHDEQGSLFRSHYHVLLIQHQRWLVSLVHFIHWMPRLYASTDRPDALWWSSDAVYRGATRQDLVTTNAVLRMLTRGAYSHAAQGRAYRQLFDQPPDPSVTRSFTLGSEPNPRILGDTEFIADVCRRTGRRSLDRTRHPRHRERDMREVLIQVIDQFCALCDLRLARRQASIWKRLVTYENVLSNSRKRPLPMVRALSIDYLVGKKVATLKEAAGFLGRSSRPMSAYRRRQYMKLFREWFGVNPEVLFHPRDEGSKDHETDFERADRPEMPNCCNSSS